MPARISEVVNHQLLEYNYIFPGPLTVSALLLIWQGKHRKADKSSDGIIQWIREAFETLS